MVVWLAVFECVTDTDTDTEGVVVCVVVVLLEPVTVTLPALLGDEETVFVFEALLVGLLVCVPDMDAL